MKKNVLCMILLVGLVLSGFAQEKNQSKLGVQQVEKKNKTHLVFPGDWSADAPRLSIPEVNDIERLVRGARPSQKAVRNTEYIVHTESHSVTGDAYVIFTDHVDSESILALKDLAKFRKGTIIYTPDLSKLYQNKKEQNRVHQRLLELGVKYVAIAPRLESYSENMILGVYELLCNLDDDPQLDALPGVLMATDAHKFAQLIERTIEYTPISKDDFAPAAICMVPNKKELRSLQKNGIMHNWFASMGCDGPMLNIYNKNAIGGPVLSGDMSYNINMAPKKFLKHIPDSINEKIGNASLWVLHGHGLPGVSCGLDIDAISEPLNSKVILCGSCFSASTQKSDFATMRISPDGFPIIPRESFAIRAIDNGAAVVFGHMRLNSGFPRLMPVLESFLNGRTVGEAYQELINEELINGKFDTSKLALREKSKNPKRIKQNILLYILFGDPALRPLEKIEIDG